MMLFPCGTIPSKVTKPIKISSPPSTAPRTLASFLYPPFNKHNHAVSLSRHHMDFGNGGCTASDATASATPTHLHRAKRYTNFTAMVITPTSPLERESMMLMAFALHSALLTLTFLPPPLVLSSQQTHMHLSDLSHPMR